jgi:hypothetical protein
MSPTRISKHFCHKQMLETLDSVVFMEIVYCEAPNTVIAATTWGMLAQSGHEA